MQFSKSGRIISAEASFVAKFQALQEGIINCAGLDVTEQEPLPLDSPLYSLDNAILTPHTAASTQQSVIRCCQAVANDIIAVIEGKEAAGAANKF